MELLGDRRAQVMIVGASTSQSILVSLTTPTLYSYTQQCVRAGRPRITFEAAYGDPAASRAYLKPLAHFNHLRQLNSTFNELADAASRVEAAG